MKEFKEVQDIFEYIKEYLGKEDLGIIEEKYSLTIIPPKDYLFSNIKCFFIECYDSETIKISIGTYRWETFREMFVPVERDVLKQELNKIKETIRLLNQVEGLLK